MKKTPKQLEYYKLYMRKYRLKQKKELQELRKLAKKLK